MVLGYTIKTHLQKEKKKKEKIKEKKNRRREFVVSGGLGNALQIVTQKSKLKPSH